MNVNRPGTVSGPSSMVRSWAPGVGVGGAIHDSSGENFITKLIRIIRQVFQTLSRDIRLLWRGINAVLALRRCMWTNTTVPDLFAARVRNHPDKVCFYYEDEVWTFKQVDEYSNRVANTFHKLGYQKDDVIALFMESRPEYVCIWLGLSKLGMCTALINFNLREQPLIHSIQAAQAKALIIGAELMEAIKDIESAAEMRIPQFCSGPTEHRGHQRSLDALLAEQPSTPPPRVRISTSDKLLYIYTSGTTGLPKPAIVTHIRFEFMSMGIFTMAALRSNDVIYTPLPLYHSAGGVLGIGQAITGGVTVAISKKFSASRFWDDCVKYNCTVAQYIGEICRYLLSQPVRDIDTRHGVRLMLGNGLRPQIWNEFVRRFNIQNMCEIYGATEGNANLINIHNRVGAVGSTPVFFNWAMPITLIRVDEITGEPIRNQNGLCIMCRAGEPGELIGKINPNDPLRGYAGYVNKAASQKKVITDVFRKGDSYFLSGDLLVRDKEGFFFFKDRTGDTFRWKGENVATAEVEAVISNLTNFRNCVVYGVEVPGSEGRAGMATIMDADGTTDIQKLGQGLSKGLSSYARPLFLRITPNIEMTGTYKMKKVDLQKDGFNPSLHTDRMYFLDPKSGQYVPLYHEITRARARL